MQESLILFILKPIPFSVSCQQSKQKNMHLLAKYNESIKMSIFK